MDLSGGDKEAEEKGEKQFGRNWKSLSFSRGRIHRFREKRENFKNKEGGKRKEEHFSNAIGGKKG